MDIIRYCSFFEPLSVTFSLYFRLPFEVTSIMTERDFNLFLEKSYTRLVAFAKPFIPLGSAVTAEDMVQDAAVKVWREIEKNRIKINNIEAFTIVVLRNVCLDSLKLKKNLPSEDIEERSFSSENYNDPQRQLEVKETLSDIRKILGSLRFEQQMVLRLRDVMGYEFHEIAGILDMSETNVRTILSRTRKSVRELILKRDRDG